MKTFVKVLLLVIIAVYVISPADFLPGPVDDVIVLLLGLLSQKKLSNKK